jgi:hypothetical protein
MVPRLGGVIENRGVGLGVARSGRFDDIDEPPAPIGCSLDQAQGLLDVTAVMFFIVQGKGLGRDVRGQRIGGKGQFRKGGAVPMTA